MAISKEEILIAIRREAAANDGLALGMPRFEAATGIKPSAWRGRYWTKWSDALVEAGFEPNAWNTAVFSDDELLEMLAELTRSLGHYPTRDEQDFHHRENPRFPFHRTMALRFGVKANQVSRLIDFVHSRDGFEDVAAMVVPLIERPQRSIVKSAGALAIAGSVYLMKSGQHYKIGRSNHVGRRSYEVALQLPQRLDVIHEIETDDPEGIERYWHERFSATRTNGEWFALSADDVAAFKRRKSFM